MGQTLSPSLSKCSPCSIWEWWLCLYPSTRFTLPRVELQRPAEWFATSIKWHNFTHHWFDSLPVYPWKLQLCTVCWAVSCWAHSAPMLACCWRQSEPTHCKFLKSLGETLAELGNGLLLRHLSSSVLVWVFFLRYDTASRSPEETPGSRIRLDLLFEQLKGLFVSSQFLNVHFRLFLLSTDLFFLLTLGLSLLLSQTFLFGLHLVLLEIVRHKNDGKIRGRVVSTSHDPN